MIILLPGTCCHWKANFGEAIPLLKPDFRVVCVSYDGFDETEENIFSVQIKTESVVKIEIHTRKNGIEKQIFRFI